MRGADPAVPEKINQTVITVGECTLRLSDVMTLIYGLSAAAPVEKEGVRGKLFSAVIVLFFLASSLGN